MSRYDDIVEVIKSDQTEEIVEIEKFNPFHDHQGKFSSSHGFKSYSANPKTKAGAMAIQRSAAAGHGRTMNVHRESKGESIAQNDNWLRTGQKPKVPAAVSRARYQQRKLQQQQNQQNQQTQQKPAAQKPAQKPAQQAQTKPAQQQTLEESVANVKYNSNDKLALQARDRYGTPTHTSVVAVDHEQARVAGKDISKSFDISKMNTSKDPIDAIAEAQGWNKGATVTNDRDVFNKACLQSGRVMMRSVDGYGNLDAKQVCNKTMADGNYPLGGNGGKVYGTGMYVVDTNIKGSTGRAMGTKVADGQQESGWYGQKQMMATVHPSAKIATQRQVSQLQQEWMGMSRADSKRFGNDFNTFVASKGYDGIKWHRDSDPSAYTTIFNKSALIFYGGAADTY